MKEKIIVENKAFLNKTDFVCIEDIVKDLKVEYKKEQVPTNWEELKNLCNENNLEIFADVIYTNALSFHENGDIKDNENSMVAENRTPQQMWQIIKSLTESLGTDVEKKI